MFLDSSMAHAAWVNSEALRRAGISPPYADLQRIEVAEALRAYTLGAEEGSTAVGKRADLAAFSRNFLESPAAVIADARRIDHRRRENRLRGSLAID